MIIYRLCSGDHIKDLSGTGSKLFGGRWNSAGLPAVYGSEFVSLCVLELLVHVKRYRLPKDYHLLSISIPDAVKPTVISSDKIKKTWKDDLNYTQFMGDEFLKSQQSLLLKIPSAIVDLENNFLINPLHADASKIKIISTKLFEFDKRLYLTND